MTGVEVGLLSVVAILLLIYSGMYVPVALGLVSFVSVWYLRGSTEAPIYLLTLAASSGLEEYHYGVIPLFVLMGLLVSQCDLGRDIYDVANYALRKIKGGLGIATVAANTAFAAITGVSIASASVFARVSVPEMRRFGYSPRFAVGVVAGSSVLGMLIPPSVMLIIYAIVAELSVADMFKAGIVPGLLLAFAYVALILCMAIFFPKYIGGQDKESRAIAEEQGVLSGLEITKKIVPFLVLILLVLGGIYGGLFTPTEAGAVGAMGALIISLIKAQINSACFLAGIKRDGKYRCLFVAAYCCRHHVQPHAGYFRVADRIWGLARRYRFRLRWNTRGLRHHACGHGYHSRYHFNYLDYGAAVSSGYAALRYKPGVVRNNHHRWCGDWTVDAALGYILLCYKSNSARQRYFFV